MVFGSHGDRISAHSHSTSLAILAVRAVVSEIPFLIARAWSTRRAVIVSLADAHVFAAAITDIAGSMLYG